jgi:hypothetical protein
MHNGSQQAVNTAVASASHLLIAGLDVPFHTVYCNDANQVGRSNSMSGSITLTFFILMNEVRGAVLAAAFLKTRPLALPLMQHWLQLPRFVHTYTVIAQEGVKQQLNSDYSNT